MLSLLLLAAVCLAPGTWMAAGADTPVTVQVQKDAAPIEASLQKDVAKLDAQAKALNRFSVTPTLLALLATMFEAVRAGTFAFCLAFRKPWVKDHTGLRRILISQTL